MEIENIPADEIVLMTEMMHRAFNAGGCNPMCHCCTNWIPVGSLFKLATVNTFEKKQLIAVLIFITMIMP